MGPAPSTTQSVENTFDMSAVNNIVFEKMTTNKASANASGANIQNLKVILRNIKGCDVKTNQTIKSNVSASTEIDAEMAEDIQNDIAAELAAQAATQLENTSQLGSELSALVSGKSNQNIKNDVKQLVETNIRNTIKNINISETVTESVNIQGKELMLDGVDCTEGGQLDFSQDITSKLAATAVTKAVTESLAKNTVVAALAATVDNESKQSRGGIAEVLDSIFGGIADMLGASTEVIAMSVAAVVCCCCLLLVLLLSPAGQSATTQFANAGASRMKGH